MDQRIAVDSQPAELTADPEANVTGTAGETLPVELLTAGY